MVNHTKAGPVTLYLFPPFQKALNDQGEKTVPTPSITNETRCNCDLPIGRCGRVRSIPQKRWLGNEKILWTKCTLGELSPQLQWTTGRTWTETSAGNSKVQRAQ